MAERSAHVFKPTRWTLVLRAQGKGEPAERALEELCRAYWFPLYAWARRSGIGAEDAEDHVQGFFVQVLEKELFARADPKQGKMRTFLLTVFRRQVRDEQDKQARLKRGAGQVAPIDAAEAERWFAAEQREEESADHLFDRQWALSVLDQALGRLEQNATRRGQAQAFQVLRPFLLADSAALAGRQDAAERLGLSPASFKVAVHRLRAKFREALRTEIAEMQGEDAAVEEELRYLLEVLRHGDYPASPRGHV